MPLLLHPHESNFSNSLQEQIVEQNNGKCTLEENFEDSVQNLVGQFNNVSTVLSSHLCRVHSRLKEG